MTIWRLHVRPDATGGNDPVSYCLSNKLIGVGWGVNPPPVTKDDYFERGQLQYDSTAWRRAATAFLHHLEKDDLVWFRDFVGNYYIARILGEWDYRNDDEAVACDILNTRSVEIVEYGKRVPGKIENCFAPRSTIQRIASDDMTLFSQVVFNDRCGREVYPVAHTVKTCDLFELLTATELEDAVGLYLQLTRNFVIIPSSRARQNNTIRYEFELRSPEKPETSLLVQVKSGNVPLTVTDYDRTGDVWFLFSTGGYIGKSTNRITLIEPNELKDFVSNNRQIMPETIRYWLNYKDKISKSLDGVE